MFKKLHTKIAKLETSFEALDAYCQMLESLVAGLEGSLQELCPHSGVCLYTHEEGDRIAQRYSEPVPEGYTEGSIDTSFYLGYVPYEKPEKYIKSCMTCGKDIEITEEEYKEHLLDEKKKVIEKDRKALEKKQKECLDYGRVLSLAREKSALRDDKDNLVI